jgi:hypothetical protein
VLLGDDLKSISYNDQARLSANRVRYCVRGKSGQYREGQSLTTTGREPRESATETKRRNVLARRKGEMSGVRARISVW